MTEASSRDDNPYAPPTIPDDNSNVDESELFGVFRRGDVMIVHHQAKLPDFCVKTNDPAVFWVKQTFSNAKSFVPVLQAHEIKFELGLSREEQRRYHARHAFIALGMLLGFIFEFGWMSLPVTTEARFWKRDSILSLLSMFTGVSIHIGFTFYARDAFRLVESILVTKNHAWLKGVHPDYLARLPEWPGEE